MSVCPKCHAENPEGVEVCVGCGTSLVPQTEKSENPIRPRPAQRVNGLAIAALSLGVLNFIPFLSILLDSVTSWRMTLPESSPLLFVLDASPLFFWSAPGVLLLSAIALGEIGNGRGAFRGRWMAIGGMTCAILLPAVFLILCPFPRHYHGARQTQCTSNQRQLALAINMYCVENRETMPGKAGLSPESPDADKQHWRIADIEGVAAGVFDCKSSPLSGAPGPNTAEYAMNADIMGVSLGQIPVPVATLLTVDTKGIDAIFSAKDIDPRHNRGFIASFVDGHVAYFNAADVPHDPEINLNGLAAPSTNKFLIQGATNVIEVKLDGREWANPSCFAYIGNKLATSSDGTSNKGTYISAYYAQVPPDDVVPKDLTIGTFVNGSNSPPFPITLPVPAKTPSAAYMTSIYYTFWLPPIVSKSRAFYTMIGKGAGSVLVAPGKAPVP